MGKRLAIWGALLLAAATTTADARTWYVRKDGTGDYTVIQDAVDHAAAGDTVRIGPGRYEEKRPYTSYPSGKNAAWTFDVYVAVTVSSLTIIGSGAGQTIIGPPSRIWVDPAEPKVICALSRVTSLVVEDLSMENVYNGAYRSEGGTLAIRRCSTLGCHAGVVTWSDQGTTVEDCNFQDIDYGVLSWSPSHSLLIAQCSFMNCGAMIDGTTGAVLSDCTISGGPVCCQYANASTGTIANCTFTNATNVAVVVTTGSTVELNDSQLLCGKVNLKVKSWSHVAGSGNELSGGETASLDVWTSTTVTMHNSHILHGTGPSVNLYNYPNEPAMVLDLTGNYWGTPDPNQVAEWIWDGNDDPSIKAFVQYLPMSGGPIATETKSWGEVKTLYGR